MTTRGERFLQGCVEVLAALSVAAVLGLFLAGVLASIAEWTTKKRPPAVVVPAGPAPVEPEETVIEIHSPVTVPVPTGSYWVSKQKFMCALMERETGFRSDVIGSRGEVGILQGRAAMVRDVNRIYGTRFQTRYLRTPSTAVTICDLYLTHYGFKRGINTVEGLARIWNGGPDGHKKRATRSYGQDVQKIVEGYR